MVKNAPPPQASAKEAIGAEMRMNGAEFARLRSSLGKSQRELAELLGISLKAVESYEQGWRKVPAHVERILYFLLFKLNEDEIGTEEPCWKSKDCPENLRSKCVAYVAKEGSFCWFFTGRLCATARGSASVAAKPGDAEGGCYTCAVFTRMLSKIEGRASRCQ
jgi:transcriptional regulator with XRE-family HTH domain